MRKLLAGLLIAMSSFGVVTSNAEARLSACSLSVGVRWAGAYCMSGWGTVYVRVLAWDYGNRSVWLNGPVVGRGTLSEVTVPYGWRITSATYVRSW